MSDVDDVMVPMGILGLALLLYVGFFTSAREWIQVRITGGTAPVTQGPPSSTVNPTSLLPYSPPGVIA